MKRLLTIAFLGCLLVACDTNNINSLPVECQTTLKTWDIYIEMLASNSNVSYDYIENIRKAKEIDIESMFRRKNKDQLIQECKETTHFVKEYMRIFKTKPQAFY